MSYSHETFSAFSSEIGAIYAGRWAARAAPATINAVVGEGPATDDNSDLLSHLLQAHRRCVDRPIAGQRTPPRAVEVAEAEEFSHLSALGITRRECQVLHCAAQGKSDADIAVSLGITVRTASKHMENILGKLHVETRAAASNIVRELWRLHS